MSPLSSKAPLKLLVIALLSLGLVMTAVYLIHYDHSILPSNTANQQAIDCTKGSQKDLASITEQTQQPDQCLYLGCSGFFQ